jgi:hypothetical protein
MPAKDAPCGLAWLLSGERRSGHIYANQSKVHNAAVAAAMEGKLCGSPCGDLRIDVQPL